MKPEQHAALRAPFPKSAIGKMPKSGIMLDFVGHAATTDRLLSVDPEWTWEPVALDPRGLPALDEFGGLWIRLTVCGVTRYGYGDAAGKKGPNAVKEAIGDAIRNAAMRFGVALDLWAKEDISNTTPAASEGSGTSGGAGHRGEAAPAPSPDRAAGNRDQGGITDAQLRKLGAMLNGYDRETRLALVSSILGREVGSAKELTQREASRVIDHLVKRQADADDAAARHEDAALEREAAS